jgi:hypothetical protein
MKNTWSRPFRYIDEEGGLPFVNSREAQKEEK